ncbi:MAG: DMT family transporter [Moraxellaceae bacterium]
MAANAGEPPQSTGIVPAYLGLVLIWSATPLSVVLSLRDFDAVWALTLRMLLAAILASALLKVLGLRLPRERTALKLYAVGSLSMFGAMMLTYLGARHLPSGMISVLFGLSPLMVGLLSQLFHRDARLSALQWLGMVLGVMGLATIFLEGDSMAAMHTPSVLMVLGGVLCYAVSAMWMKRMPHSLPPLVQTCGALWLSALGCVLVLPVLGGAAPSHMPGVVSLSALLFSASLGSIVAMVCYFFLLQHMAVATMALTTLITPVFALLLGMLFNHERFHVSTLWGMGLIMVGLAGYYEHELRRVLLRPALA